MAVEGAFRVGSGEPLLLIHGFSGAPGMWRPIVADLQDSFEILAVALSGHASGPALPEGVEASVETLVDAIESEMDAIGWRTAHIAGNSLGGWIALELAARGRARSVVALSPAGGWEQGSSQERRLRRLFTRNHAISTRLLPYLPTLVRRPRLRRAILSGAASRADRLSPAQALAFVQSAVDCEIYFDLMDAILRDGPPSDFEGITCPVLLAWGTKDRVLPAGGYAQRMRNLVPAAHWMDMPGLGHVPMGDDPRLISSLIADFAAAADGPVAEQQMVAQALA